MPALFGFAPLPQRRSQSRQAALSMPERRMFSGPGEISRIASRKKLLRWQNRLAIDQDHVAANTEVRKLF
jgi:hypothetical protein